MSVMPKENKSLHYSSKSLITLKAMAAAAKAVGAQDRDEPQRVIIISCK